MLYENINTIEKLKEFVDKLNELSHYDQYVLVDNVFMQKGKRALDLNLKEIPRKGNVSHQRWLFAIGENFTFYATFRINSKLSVEKPEMKTGAYEKIYFHLSENDISGISQN